MSMNRRELFSSSALLLGTGLLLKGRAVDAAPAPVAPARARLCFNENPAGPPASAREAMLRAWDEAGRYMPAGLPELRKVAAAQWGVPEDHVLVTQGSSEGLSASAAAFASRGEVVGASPTYLQLLTYAESAGARVVRVPLDGALRHDLPAMEKAVTPFTSLVYVCNPNNPTGTLVGSDELEGFIRAVAPRSPVFVDEAYFDYVEVPGHRSTMGLAVKGLDVVVSRTMSKIHGMAGMRVGFLVARPAILERIRPFLQGFPNALAVRAAIAALQDQRAQGAARALNAASRAAMVKAVQAAGRKVAESHANLIFFHTGKPIAEVIKAFAERGVDVGRAFPPLEDWCRVSTGTMPDTERFIAAMKQVLTA